MADEKQVKRLQNLAAKRETLEGLIGIAQGLTRLEKAFQDVIVASRPSQRIPDRVKQYIANLNEKVKNLPDEPLVGRMGKIDGRLSKGVKYVLKLADLDTDKPSVSIPKPPSPQDFRKLLYGFKNSTQQTVALRAIAQGRGIPVQPIKLPIQQEAIFKKVERLKAQEEHSREVITGGLKEFIADAEAIAYNERFPEDMRETAKEASTQMRENLELIESGKPFDELPNPFESVSVDASDNTELYAELSEPPKEQVSESTSEKPKASKKQSGAEPENAEPVSSNPSTGESVVLEKATPKPQKKQHKMQDTPNGLWKRINFWLDSSWDVNWKDTKYLDMATYAQRKAEKTAKKR